MSKSGNDINYSLRLQKNIERKIFGDILRSMSYFGPIEEYRYIGFGSFYYQDFVMFHKDFSIKEGVSIEICKNNFARNDDVVMTLLNYWERNLKFCVTYWEELKLELQEISQECLLAYIEGVCEVLTRSFICNISKISSLFPRCTMIKTDVYDYSKAKTLNKLEPYVYGKIKKCIYEKLSLEVKQENIINWFDVRQDCEKLVTKIGFDKLIQIDEEKIQKMLQNVSVNRYTYNKPYGFINIIFDEASIALDSIIWEKNKRNIIWLDYDQFLEPIMLDALEKVILNASRGSVIIFSVSMKSTPEERVKAFEDNFEESHRLTKMPSIGECDKATIHSTIYDIVADTVKAAMCDKNTILNENEKNYKCKQVMNCKYADGIPMFTYALYIYDEDDDENNEYFPSNILKKYEWFSENEERYVINFPALTNKEISAINQYLPENDEDTIISMFPFIPSKTIKNYIRIYKYYPQYIEAGYYV